MTEPEVPLVELIDLAQLPAPDGVTGAHQEQQVPMIQVEDAMPPSMDVDHNPQVESERLSMAERGMFSLFSFIALWISCFFFPLV